MKNRRNFILFYFIFVRSSSSSARSRYIRAQHQLVRAQQQVNPCAAARVQQQVHLCAAAARSCAAAGTSVRSSSSFVRSRIVLLGHRTNGSRSGIPSIGRPSRVTSRTECANGIYSQGDTVAYYGVKSLGRRCPSINRWRVRKPEVA